MNREVHVRICEGRGVRLPPATRRRLERRGKRRGKTTSGVGRKDERWAGRKRPSAVRSVENILDDIKTGVYRLSRDESGGHPSTAQVVSGVQAA